MQKIGAKPGGSPGKMTQIDLIAYSVEETTRRHNAKIAVDGWVQVNDAALATQLGEDVAVVTELSADGSIAKVKTRFSSLAPVSCRASQLRPCLALGDRVMHAGKVGTVFSVHPTGRTTYYLLDEWGTDGAAADTPRIGTECEVSEVGLRSRNFGRAMAAVSSRPTPNLTAKCGLFVRGHRDGSVGPELSTADFLKVALPGEPCFARVVGDRAVTATTPRGQAVLVDFAGGATLWIWEAVLVENKQRLFACDKFLLPSHNRHPPTARIATQNIITTGGATPTDETQPAVPALKEAMTTKSAEIDTLCAGTTPAKSSIIMIEDDYHDLRQRSVLEIRRVWTEEQLADCIGDLGVIEDEDVDPGMFEVTSIRKLELPDGREVPVLRLRAAGHKSSTDRWDVFAAFAKPMAGQSLALTDGTSDAQGGALSRLGKKTGQAMMNAAKDGARAAKDHAVGVGKRKVLALATEATQGTAVAVHGSIRQTTLAIAGALAGADDPQAFAGSAMAQTMFNEGSVMAMKVGAGFFESISPKFASIIRVAAETIETGIDRRQAQGVLDKVAPVAVGGLRALAQATFAKAMPALAAPAAAPAPTPQLDAAPEDRPPPRRTRKPKAPAAPSAPVDDTPAEKPRRARKAKPQDGGAQ